MDYTLILQRFQVDSSKLCWQALFASSASTEKNHTKTPEMICILWHFVKYIMAPSWSVMIEKVTSRRKAQKFNYVFNTIDLPYLYDEWESVFCDGEEKSSIHCEQLIT